MLSSAFNVQPAKAWTGTVFIRADGSINPPTAPVHRDGDLYTLTGNITVDTNGSGIAIDRDNVILDGAGYTLQGCAHADNGVVLSGRSNVTIKNMEIRYFVNCIYLSWSSNTNIVGVNISRYYWGGIYLTYSTCNRISGNIIFFEPKPSGQVGIFLTGSSNGNTVSGNNITNWGHTEGGVSDPGYYGNGIRIVWSSNNRIYGNNITNKQYAVPLYYASNNRIYGNNIANNQVGIYFESASDNNDIYGNNITACYQGITIYGCANNRIYHNTFIDNVQSNVAMTNNCPTNFWDDGYPSGGNYSGGNYWSNYMGADVKSGPNQDQPGSDLIGDVPISFNANNKDNYPLISLFGVPPAFPAANFTYPSYDLVARQTSVVFNASRSTCANGTITDYIWSFGDGKTAKGAVTSHVYDSGGKHNVTLKVTSNSRLFDSQTRIVTLIEPTSQITVSTRASSAFAGYVVDIYGTLSGLYGRGLDSKLVLLSYAFPGVSTWIPITSATTDNSGNYHATWIPSATGYFTIYVEWTGNTTYFETINAVTFCSISYENQYVFSVEASNTIMQLTFDDQSRKLKFTTSGQNGTLAYAKVTIPKSPTLDASQFEVYLDGNEQALTEYSIASLQDVWVLTFLYNQSTHQIEVYIPQIIPRTTFLGLDWTIWAIIIVIVTGFGIGTALIFRRRKRSTNQHSQRRLIS
jgi:parallel beta-helix repeat protein